MTPPSLRLRALRWLSRRVQKPLLARIEHPHWARWRVKLACALFLASPFGFRTIRLGGMPARRLAGGSGTLFYIHGGAFALFSARTHQGTAARLAGPLGMHAVLPDYPLAPEHPFPQALDRIESAYAELAASGQPIVIAGDSAGGGLAFSLLGRIVANGLPAPAAVLAFSPWVDLTLSGESIIANAKADPLLPAEKMPLAVSEYLAGADPRDPDASPVFGSYSGAPPVLIQIARDEILLSDAEAMAARLRADGVEVDLQLLDHGIHAFQMLHGWLPEADAAMNATVAFAKHALAKGAH